MLLSHTLTPIMSMKQLKNSTIMRSTALLWQFTKAQTIVDSLLVTSQNRRHVKKCLKFSTVTWRASSRSSCTPVGRYKLLFVIFVFWCKLQVKFQAKNLNRGFAFLEFETHMQASVARRQLHPRNLIVWNQPLYVDWADPVPDVSPSVMAQVNTVHT